MALGTVETRETTANTSAIVAQASAGAVSAGLVAVAVEGVGAGGALLQVAGGASVAGIAEAAHVLHGVPGRGVGAAGFGGEVLLGPASAAVIAVVGAECALASNTIVAREAVAGTSGTITRALVGALHPWVKVIGVHDVSDPSEVLGAGALRAIRAGPLRFTIKTSEAFAVVIGFTCSVVGAMVLAHTSLAVSALVESNLSPRFGFVRRSSRGN